MNILFVELNLPSSKDRSDFINFGEGLLVDGFNEGFSLKILKSLETLLIGYY